MEYFYQRMKMEKSDLQTIKINRRKDLFFLLENKVNQKIKIKHPQPKMQQWGRSSKMKKTKEISVTQKEPKLSFQPHLFKKQGQI